MASGSDTGGWGRDKDEDDREWARRCARMANRMCKRRKDFTDRQTFKNMIYGNRKIKAYADGH